MSRRARLRPPVMSGNNHNLLRECDRSQRTRAFARASNEPRIIATPFYDAPLRLSPRSSGICERDREGRHADTGRYLLSSFRETRAHTWRHLHDVMQIWHADEIIGERCVIPPPIARVSWNAQMAGSWEHLESPREIIVYVYARLLRYIRHRYIERCAGTKIYI